MNPAVERRPEALAILPARGGSKGIRHKNIAPLAGKPLIAKTIAAALAAGTDLATGARHTSRGCETLSYAMGVGSTGGTDLLWVSSTGEPEDHEPSPHRMLCRDEVLRPVGRTRTGACWPLEMPSLDDSGLSAVGYWLGRVDVGDVGAAAGGR